MRVIPPLTITDAMLTSSTCAEPHASVAAYNPATAYAKRIIDTLEEYAEFFKGDGGFAWVHWAGTHEDEDEMAKRFETSIRCIPFEDQIPEAARGAGTCILTGKPSAQRVLMAKAY